VACAEEDSYTGFSIRALTAKRTAREDTFVNLRSIFLFYSISRQLSLGLLMVPSSSSTNHAPRIVVHLRLCMSSQPLLCSQASTYHGGRTPANNKKHHRPCFDPALGPSKLAIFLSSYNIDSSVSLTSVLEFLLRHSPPIPRCTYKTPSRLRSTVHFLSDPAGLLNKTQCKLLAIDTSFVVLWRNNKMNHMQSC
jgi:hypothetical protein